MTAKYSSFHLILPVYNEQKRIASVLHRCLRLCAHVTIVDNFSTDSTLQLARSICSTIDIVQISNSGTIENPEWWQSLESYLKTDYILLGSCSEFIPDKLLAIFSRFSLSAIADILFVPRTSITSQLSMDWLYAQPKSVITGHLSLPTVARLLRYSAINSAMIKPHDTFRSQTSCTSLTLNSSCLDLIIHHYREAPSFKTLYKHQHYAKCYVDSHIRSNVALAILDSSARVVLDTCRLARSLLHSPPNKVLLHEYALRVLMHFQSVIYSARHLVMRVIKK
jgi:hypothetical protein